MIQRCITHVTLIFYMQVKCMIHCVSCILLLNITSDTPLYHLGVQKNMTRKLTHPPKSISFVQWEKSSMQAFRSLVAKSPAAAQILALITEKMDITNALVISQTTMAELCNISRPTVARAIQLLKDRNWIQTVRIGSSTAYVCNQSVFWQQGRDKRHYADFTARVIASSVEQKKSVSELNNETELHKLPSPNKDEKVTILDDTEPPSQEEIEY